MRHARAVLRYVSQVAAAGLLIGCAGESGPEPLDPALTATAWREDLHVLARELPERHANAFHSITRTAFDSAVAALDTAIPHLGEDAIVVSLRRIIASVGDGHTNLSFPGNWPLLPLRFSWFGDPVNDPSHLELRITYATPSYERVLGSRVVEVGDHTIPDAFSALSTIIAQGESVGSTRDASEFFLRSPNVLHGLGIIPTADSVRFTLAEPDGKEILIWVRPTIRGAPLVWRAATRREPLYLSRPDDSFWFTSLPDARGDSSTVYLALGGYPDYFTFWRRSRALLDYVDRRRPTRLIIDLRDNGGGDFNKVRRLLIPGLRARLRVDGPGRLYVLTGPATFSAAMTNAVDLRRELSAILVGAPTGARPNGYQEGEKFRLPRSRMSVSVATRYYRFQDEDTPGVLPDHHAVASWQQYRAGWDPALEWVLAGATR